jgi:hypothetical protein
MWKIPQAHYRDSKNRCGFWSSNEATFFFKDKQFEAVVSDKEKAA